MQGIKILYAAGSLLPQTALIGSGIPPLHSLKTLPEGGGQMGCGTRGLEKRVTENVDGEKCSLIQSPGNNSKKRSLKPRCAPKPFSTVYRSRHSSGWSSSVDMSQTAWSAEQTSAKGTMDQEGSARNSCNSWPLYARWADQRACFG